MALDDSASATLRIEGPSLTRRPLSRITIVAITHYGVSEDNHGGDQQLSEIRGCSACCAAAFFRMRRARIRILELRVCDPRRVVSGFRPPYESTSRRTSFGARHDSTTLHPSKVAATGGGLVPLGRPSGWRRNRRARTGRRAMGGMRHLSVLGQLRTVLLEAWRRGMAGDARSPSLDREMHSPGVRRQARRAR